MQGIKATFDLWLGKSKDSLCSVRERVTYTYNGDAQRVSEMTNGVLTTYVIDPNRSLYEVVQEQNSSGAVTASYTFGSTRLATWNGSTVTFELNDRLGSVRMVTDTSGNITTNYNYDVFGGSEINWTT